MILELFIVLLFVALVAMGLGYFTGDQHYALVGLFFLFLLGTFLFSNSVEYETGATVNTTYTYTGANITGSTTNIAYTTSAFTGSYARWFGVLLSVSAGFGIAFSLMNWRAAKKEEEEK